LTERVSLKYSVDVFNLTNHPSFDIPIDNIDQNLTFNPTPTTGQTCSAFRSGVRSQRRQPVCGQ